MKRTTWRIVQKKHAGNAFDGEGARRFGGRWNERGIPMVYTAGSRALAALELLVHLDAPLLLEIYCCIPVSFDDALCTIVEADALPGDWRKDPAPVSTRMIGGRWVQEMSSPVLAVPSAIVPSERNYLLNPSHVDFKKLKIGQPEDFWFDPRLIKM